MTTIAYLRMSSNPVEMQTQKRTILAFAKTQPIEIDRFIVSSDLWRKEKRETKTDRLKQLLQTGDTLVVSDLSCMGRSIGEIVIIVDALITRGIRFIAVNETMDSARKQDALTQIRFSMFSVLAQIEKDLISHRTKEGLAKAVAKGKKLGRPKGSFSRSRLDRRRNEIKKLLALGVSKASIAKITGVNRSTLVYYIKSRRLV